MLNSPLASLYSRGGDRPAQGMYYSLSFACMTPTTLINTNNHHPCMGAEGAEGAEGRGFMITRIPKVFTVDLRSFITTTRREQYAAFFPPPKLQSTRVKQQAYFLVRNPHVALLRQSREAITSRQRRLRCRMKQEKEKKTRAFLCVRRLAGTYSRVDDTSFLIFARKTRTAT